MTFMDSSVVHSVVRWSKEAQVSEREALAIVVGGADTPAARLLGLVGLLKWLPVFATRGAAKAALDHGRRPRPERPLTWLTDLALATERDDAQIGADAADQRLDDAVANSSRGPTTPIPRPTPDPVRGGRLEAQKGQYRSVSLTTHPRAAGTRCVGRRTPY